MPQCPQCNIELEDDFGIVDCKSCGAVCSVDLNGDIQVQDAQIKEGTKPYEDFNVTTTEEEFKDEAELLKENQSIEEEFKDEAELLKENQSIFDEEDTGEDLKNLVSEEIKFDAKEPALMKGDNFLKDLEFFIEESTFKELEHVYYDLNIFEIKDWEMLIQTLADERLEITQEGLGELKKDDLDLVVPQLTFLRLSVVYKKLLPLGVKMSWALSEEQQPRTQEDGEQDYGGNDLGE